jgi:hypothetical protein
MQQDEVQNTIARETKLKWDTTNSVPSMMDFGILDRVQVQQQKSKHMKIVRSHTLLHAAW